MQADSAAQCGALHSSRLVTLLVVLLLFQILSIKTAYGAQLTVAWDPNNDSATAGYKLYYGTQSKAYDVSIDVGNSTQHQVADLKPGTLYYFAATAYDAGGNESDFSEELVVNTPSDPAFNSPLPDPALDSDKDGIPDVDEINIYGTDPNNPDSDGDGISDGQELQLWGGKWRDDDDGNGIINLLDPDATPSEPKNRVDMGPVYSLLLD